MNQPQQEHHQQQTSSLFSSPNKSNSNVSSSSSPHHRSDFSSSVKSGIEDNDAKLARLKLSSPMQETALMLSDVQSGATLDVLNAAMFDADNSADIDVIAALAPASLDPTPGASFGQSHHHQNQSLNMSDLFFSEKSANLSLSSSRPDVIDADAADVNNLAHELKIAAISGGNANILESMVDLVNEFYVGEEEEADKELKVERYGNDDEEDEEGEEEDDDDEDSNDDDEDTEDSNDDDDEEEEEEEGDEEATSNGEEQDLSMKDQTKPKRQALAGSFSFTSGGSGTNCANLFGNSQSVHQQQKQQQFFVGSVGSSLSTFNRKQTSQTPVNSRKHARTNNNSGKVFFLLLKLKSYGIYTQSTKNYLSKIFLQKL